MRYTSPRLHTLAFVLRCLRGRPPTHAELVCAYFHFQNLRRDTAAPPPPFDL